MHYWIDACDPALTCQHIKRYVHIGQCGIEATGDSLNDLRTRRIKGQYTPAGDLCKLLQSAPPRHLLSPLCRPMTMMFSSVNVSS